jgi:hypothetical protein
MKKELMNLFLFIACCFIIYILFRNLNFKPREGMTDASGNNTQAAAVTNGIAANAEAYAANVKSATIKQQDIFLISKYRSSYENIIFSLDDYISNLMLNTVLNINLNTPAVTMGQLSQLASLNQAQVALNNVMKYVDKSS